jgi:uncharacterized protein (DUF2236 family)
MADFFPRGSVIRRVNSEPALLFGAGRALILQLADPAVAAGVADHSEFEQNPFKRLQGTLEATYAAVFGTEALATSVGRRIRWVHEFVVGPGYRANDPEHLLWVHATLVETALGCYTSLVAPLDAADAETYYQEMTRVGGAFGLSRDDQPADLAEFRGYVDERVRSFEVSDTARDLAAFILEPTLPGHLEVPLAPTIAVQRLFAVATTPEPLRRQFGFRWDDRGRRRYERACAVLRAGARVTPRAVRTGPNHLWGRLLLRQAAARVRRFEEERAAARPAGHDREESPEPRTARTVTARRGVTSAGRRPR